MVPSGNVPESLPDLQFFQSPHQEIAPGSKGSKGRVKMSAVSPPPSLMLFTTEHLAQ